MTQGKVHLTSPPRKRRRSKSECGESQDTRTSKGTCENTDSSLHSHPRVKDNKIHQGEDDITHHHDSGWVDVEETPKPISALRIKPFVKVTQERRHYVLTNNPDIARKATDDDILENEYAELSEIIKPLLNTTLPLLDMSNHSLSEEDVSSMYEKYQREYCPLLDKTVKAFFGRRFKSVDDAVCTLTMVMRSYVSGFSVHRKMAYSVANGFKKFVLQCHTLNNKKRKPSAESESREPRNKGKCPWSCILQFNKEFAEFIKISSFSDHSIECLRRYSRMTSNEVSFQQGIPKEHLIGITEKLHQRTVLAGTLRKREQRMNSAVESEIDAAFLRRIDSEGIDETISNLKEFGMEPDKEVDLILYTLVVEIDFIMIKLSACIIYDPRI